VVSVDECARFSGSPKKIKNAIYLKTSTCFNDSQI